MKLSKSHIFLIVLNIICFVLFLNLAIISVKKLLLLRDSYLFFINLLSTLLFMVPYFLFLWITIYIFKHHKLKHFKVFLILTIICSVVSIAFVFWGIYGIYSMIDSIEGIKQGYIYSDIYTQEQLLIYSTKNLYQNIYSVVCTIVFAFSNIWGFVSIYKKFKP